MPECRPIRRRLLPLALLTVTPIAHAQMPFYTDDTEVTDRGTLHIEAFDEMDSLQSSQYPDLRQNTDNLKLNAGLPYRLEIDLDAPYLTIYRADGTPSSRGIGDTDFGLKWKAREATALLQYPALAASFYVEVPTGNVREELGSGITDYWLNLIAQEPLGAHTRMNLNLGLLFAGNTSTGVVGIETTRGQVYTGGLSMLHDVNDRLTVGVEIYGGISSDPGLDRDQLQGMIGAEYGISRNVTICAGLVGGEYSATPRLGGQIGIEADFPGVLGGSKPSPLTSNLFAPIRTGATDGL